MSEIRALPVPDKWVGERVDTAIAEMFGMSRSKAASLCESGSVLIDGKTVRKSDRLLPDSLIEVHLETQESTLPKRSTSLPVVYDDEDIVVIDKPMGVAAHPSPGWEGPTVTDSLEAAGYTISTSGAPERQGIVHRLDVGTSGLMVVTKTDLAYSVLKQAFRDRAVEKKYLALVQGHPDPSEGTIDAPIGRMGGGDYRFAVMSTGRHAITHYRVLDAYAGASLVEVTLETGRTHQIRVHFSALRHPCVGDLTYGADPVLAEKLGLTRQWLHASQLSFAHPRTGELVKFTSEPSEDLRRALSIVEGQWDDSPPSSG